MAVFDSHIGFDFWPLGVNIPYWTPSWILIFMYLSVKYALEMNSVTPKTVDTSVCLIILANPIIYAAAMQGAIFDFNFFS